MLLIQAGRRLAEPEVFCNARSLIAPQIGANLVPNADLGASRMVERSSMNIPSIGMACVAHSPRHSPHVAICFAHMTQFALVGVGNSDRVADKNDMRPPRWGGAF